MSLYRSLQSIIYIFDVRRTVNCNFISIVKSTRCTNVSNLFYFGMTLLLASRQQYLFDKCLSLYVQSRTLDDVHVECHSKIK